MTVTSTSLEAYYELFPNLSQRQNMVYNIIKLYPGVSNLDISRMLSLPINSITPRVYELRKYNLVTYSHKKKDRLTGRTAWAWKIVENPKEVITHQL